jgi:hypothetical protein
MRKSLILGVVLIPLGLVLTLPPAMGPTVVSQALEHEGTVVMTKADDCSSVASRIPSFGGASPTSFMRSDHIRLEWPHCGQVCIPGPECGVEDAEVLVFPEGNGLIYQCRARSALGVLTPQEGRSLLGGLLALLGSMALVFAPPVRDRIARRRWAAIEDEPPGSG